MSTNCAIHISRTEYWFLISWPVASPVWLIKDVSKDPILSPSPCTDVGGDAVWEDLRLFFYRIPVLTTWVHVYLRSGSATQLWIILLWKMKGIHVSQYCSGFHSEKKSFLNKCWRDLALITEASTQGLSEHHWRTIYDVRLNLYFLLNTPFLSTYMAV